MPIRRRSVTGSVSGPEMSAPSNVSDPRIRNPGIRSFILLKHRKSVLLPQPEGPISAVILFRGMSIDTSRSAIDAPYQTDRSRAERTVGSAVPWAAGARAAAGGPGGGGGVGVGGAGAAGVLDGLMI